jgi:hypothetical protein
MKTVPFGEEPGVVACFYLGCAYGYVLLCVVKVVPEEHHITVKRYVLVWDEFALSDTPEIDVLLCRPSVMFHNVSSPFFILEKVTSQAAAHAFSAADSSRMPNSPSRINTQL